MACWLEIIPEVGVAMDKIPPKGKDMFIFLKRERMNKARTTSTYVA